MNLVIGNLDELPFNVWFSTTNVLDKVVEGIAPFNLTTIILFESIDVISPTCVAFKSLSITSTLYPTT